MSIKKSPLSSLMITLVLVTATFAGCFYPSKASDPKPVPKATLPKFDSCQSLVKAFKRSLKANQMGRDAGIPLTSPSTSAEMKDGSTESTPDHSTTNVQVEGVDEADIVKNDGKYIYLVAKNQVIICLAYPPSQSKVLFKSTLEPNCTVRELYIGENRLVAIGTRYSAENHSNLTFIKIWNTTNKSNPRVLREMEFEGAYSTSRKIADFLYLVLNSYPDYSLYDEEDIQCQDIIPKYRDIKDSSTDGDLKPIAECTEIGHLHPDSFSVFLTILSIPMEDGEEAISKQVIAGSSENVYASRQNLYVVNSEYDYKVWPFRDYPINGDEKTTIYKFALGKGHIDYSGSASVPGSVLNQFSMDEHKGYFRIATTRGYVWAENSKATNNIYVLDKNLETVGKIENIAPGEKIYSARFMGDQGYLVTFKKVDPFFTLDLEDPENPRIIGELKIPGYSDYLHPYDENYIIGMGKNTVEAEEGNFAWYQGLKMALFDVSDFQNPREMHKVEIGDRGTDSYVLHDHKALLFDRKRNLLVIPVLLAELPEAEEKEERLANQYGNYTYQGAYLYELSPENGFELKGRITHKESFNQEMGYYYYDDETAVKRSLYIGDFLYTVSEVKIMIHDLDDLQKVNEVDLK